MSSAWQHPHVNLFKVFAVGQWKKCSKEGDVSSMMDRDIKSTVFRVLGSIPAANYIQIPKTSSQSLSLTGQYLYAIFKPLPGKYFVLHLETVNSSGMVIRLSFSNLFKEFKSTSTWLQFPFACNSDKENNPKVTDTIPTSLRWTLLKINLKAILSKYLHTQYSYLKNVKICANLLVKNIFTSEFDYSPFTFDSFKFAQPLPREIALPLTKDEEFSDKYDYMQYPYEPNENGSSSQRSSTRKLKGMHPQVSVLPSMSSEMTAEPDRGTPSPDRTARQEHTDTREGKTLPKSQPNPESRVLRLKPRLSKEAPEIVSLKSTATEKVGRTVRSTPRAGRVLKSQQQRTKKLSGGAVRSEQELEEVHVYTEGGGGVAVHREGSRKSVIVKGMKQEFQSLQPDPILRLNKVIGFGGHGTGQLLFGRDGESVFYPCHCLVIAMEIKTGEQIFYIGHTDKVSCIALNHSRSLLASGQSGPLPLVRLWGVESARCLALFKTHSSGLHSLSFSHSGGVLCGVGRDGHGKGQVVLWGTAQAPRTGDVSVLAKAHTDAGIDHMRIASFDDSRMVSCGWDNVRFWRLKGGSLRSCPVNLEKHHQMHFTDVQFQPGFHNESDLTDRSVFASTKTGHIFEIHYKSISVKRKWHVLASNPGGVPILSLAVHEGFCVTGSEDGVLRVWPLDFSARLMEAEHDGPVSAVDISEDGLRILAGTTAGNIGLLDASSSSYSTLMRSHREVVQCMSVTGSEVAEICLVSCSLDHTIRVWDSRSGKQLFDFHTPGDIGCAVVWHPSLPVFACGFKSGVVRLFHVPSTTVLSEHKSHNGVITGVVFSPSGHALYSSSSTGSLAMYDLSDISAAKVIRVLANTVAKGEVYGPRALSVSQGGQRLAFIGPLDSTVSVLDAESLDEVLRLDITPMSTHHSTTATPNPALETAKMVTFSHKALNQLLVITSTSRLLKFSASNGQLLSEVAHIHRASCTAVCPSNRHLLTAGDNVLKVWDYGMALDLNFQVFIGHSEPITEVLFSPNGDQVVSCGDAIFLWDFLGYTPPTFTPPHSPCKPLPRSVSPRRSAPAPVNYEPIKMHSFTPLAPTSKHKPLTGNTSRRQASTTALIDDDTLYEPHIVSQSPDHSSDNQEGPDNRLGADQEENINVFKKRNFEDQDSESGSEDVPMQQDKDDGQGVHPSPSSPPYSPPHTLPSPASHSHYHHRPPKATLAEHLYVAPPNQAGLIRQKVLGVNGAARNNVIWEPNSGLFVYSSGCIVVMEDLSTGKQTHMLGHTEEVSTLAAQHDVRDIASASPAFGHTPCEIRIWRVGSAKCTKVLTVHSHSVQSMAFSKDDRLLLSVGTYLDGTLAVWSTHDYSLLTATTLDHHVHQADWDPHTAYELTSVGEGLRFWLVEEDRSNRTCELKVHEPELPAEVVKTSSRSNLEFTSLCYGADSMLFIGTNTGVITLWETKGNKCLMYWTTDLLEVSTLFSSAGRLFSADVAGCMHLWSVESGQPLPTVSLLNSMHVPGGVFSASFDSKLELGIVGTSSGTVHYVNWPDTTKVSIVSGHSSKISSLDITRDNSLLATASTDGSVAVWRMDSLEQTVLFQAPKTACNCVAFAPINEQGQGKTSPSVVAGYSDGMLRVFDLESLKMSRKMKPHLEHVRAVAYSQDGHVIISGCSSGVVAISNSASGLVVRVITDHQGAPITDIHIAIKPAKLPDPGADECYLWLVASGDRRVSVWSSEWSKDRCQLVDWLTFPGPFFAPNGTRLKKGDKCQYELLPPSLARFSPSNPDTIVYTGYGMERCVQFYSISKKTVTRNCSLTHWATSMDLSPDGHLVAIGCEERVLKLMDSDEGAFQDYTGHHDSVDRINFSPNGKQLISASSNSLHIWDITL